MKIYEGALIALFWAAMACAGFAATFIVITALDQAEALWIHSMK